MRCLIRSYRALVSVCAIAFLFMFHAANIPERRTSDRTAHAAESRRQLPREQPDVPAELRAAIEEARYRLEPEGTGKAGYRAPNPAQGWRARFGAEGLRIETQAAEGRAAQGFAMRLKAYGYGDQVVPVERAEMVSAGNRVEYRRGSLVEWYVNERRGVEQGFTLQEPPTSGKERARGEALTLRLAVEGSLRAELGADAGSVRFVDAAGERTLVYDQLVAFDAGGRKLPARMQVEGRELRLEVDDTGAQYPLTIDPFIRQQKLQASDATPISYFGNSVSISGDTAIVAAPLAENSGRAHRGAAYVFVRSGGVWSEQQKLLPSDTPYNGSFGSMVAIDGETAVVASGGSSSAYVFVRSGGVWSEQQKLRPPPGIIPFPDFGSAVAISGETIIVNTFVFVRNGTTWTEQARLKHSDPDARAGFGSTVAISGETIVVGSLGDSINGVEGAGAAHVFTRSRGVWSEQQKLWASDPTSDDYFGQSVSISGETIIVGAHAFGGSRPGSAYIFTRSGGVWSQQQRLQGSNTAMKDQFGFSVSINGDTAVVGAWQADNSGVRTAGSAYVFNRSGTTWTEQTLLQADDAVQSAQYGVGVSISGDTIIVTASIAQNSAGARVGAAYVYINAAPAAGQVVISEFRLAGPGGSTDEFFELYNHTNSDITVVSSDGSAGWTLRSSDGTLNFLIPNGDVIPARGHYLLANTGGYSLAAYPTAQPGCASGNCAFPDRALTSDTPENTGIALFRTADPANFNTGNQLDAVGPNTEANPLYREGAGYAPVSGSTGTVQYSLTRKLSTGMPADSGDNANDFLLVATDGAATLPGATLGAPGPENTGSPIQRNAAIKASLVDPQCAGFGTMTSACARVRTDEGANASNAAYGTLRLRRKFTNTTNVSITRLRFRVVDITTTPEAGMADLRVLGGTGSFMATAQSGGAMSIQRLTLEQPGQPHGAGYNSTLSADTVALNSPLLPGESINVEFLLGVQQEGNYRFFVNVEAFPATTTAATVGRSNLKTGRAKAKGGKMR